MSSTFTPTPRPTTTRRFIKRPDSAVRDAKLEEINADIKQKDAALKDLGAQLDKFVIDAKLVEKRKELQKTLGELRKQQGGIKEKRQEINDKIKQEDAVLKRKVAEIQTQQSKNSFKSVAEIDTKISSLDSLISTGTLALADERRHVKEMSSLRKLRKDFGSIEVQQKEIDDIKAKIATLKKDLSAAQSKEISSEYDRIQKEIDDINASTKAVADKRSSLNAKRTEVKKAKDELYTQVRSVRGDFDKEFQNFKKLMTEERKRREVEEKEQRVAEAKSQRKEIAEAELAEASVPAFTQEIDSIHTLLSYFDPSHVRPVLKVLPVSTFENKTNLRTVEMPADVVILKKEEESFFAATAGKSKRNKKVKSKFTIEPDVIATLGELDIALPASKDDVPKAVESLRLKLDELTKVQDETTKKNIEKAQAKIAKLEAEAEAEAAAEEAKKAEEEAATTEEAPVEAATEEA